MVCCGLFVWFVLVAIARVKTKRISSRLFVLAVFDKKLLNNSVSISGVLAFPFLRRKNEGRYLTEKQAILCL